MRIESGAWSGESHGWENTCSGSQVSRCCTDWHETWSRVMCRDTGPHDILVTMTRMSWCHGHLNTSTVISHTCVKLDIAVFVCLYLHLSSPVSDLLDCLCFLEILFWQSNNNNVDPSLPRNSQTDQFGATCVTWLSWERVTHDTSVTRAWLLLSPPVCCLCSRDHQSPISGTREHSSDPAQFSRSG